MKKGIVLMLTVLMMMSLTACATEKVETSVNSDQQETQTGTEVEKRTLTILVEAGSPGELVANGTKEEFESMNPGVTVVVDPVPYSGIFDKMSTEIKSGNIVHDVATLDVLWLSAFKRGIEPLNEFITDDMTADFLPTMLEGGTMQYVTGNVATPILADESVFSAEDAVRLITGRAADLINIKLMKTGGIYEALKICAIAETYGVECMIGCMLESKISVSAAAHLAAAKSVITRADLDGPSLCSRDPYEGGPVFDGPKIYMPETPGIGILTTPCFAAAAGG